MGARKVFSAQAEVFLLMKSVMMMALCFLRASGGVSTYFHIIILKKEFSPRKRRCFPPTLLDQVSGGVFSAQAEVFLNSNLTYHLFLSFLRASGGVSFFLPRVLKKKSFSPRKRRCF